MIPLAIERQLRACRDSIHEAAQAIARARQATGTPEQVARAWAEAENTVAAISSRALADAVHAAKLDAMDVAIRADVDRDVPARLDPEYATDAEAGEYDGRNFEAALLYGAGVR